MLWPAWWIVRGSIPRLALRDKPDVTVGESPSNTLGHYAVVMVEREEA